MAQWYVKDLSKLTQVSVQTLHHYDRIGLLIPSLRAANGYRIYSEKDLLKLQQIIALKYFGFELLQIKTLLAGDVDVIDHFASQSQFLEEKAQNMLNASKTMKRILSECSNNQSLSWETIIKLIEVYRMTQELEKSWAAKVLSPDEFKNYVKFTQELPDRFSAQEKAACEAEWAAIIREIHANINQDPSSATGIAIGERCLKWVNKLYGSEHASLRKAVWEKGFKTGNAGDEHGLSPEGVKWLDKAMYAFHSDRIRNILKKVDTHPHDEVLKLWNDMLFEMYGDEQSFKDELVREVFRLDKLSTSAKDWLKKVSKL